MSLLDHERYCAAITDETALLRDTVRGADLTRTVPTCPDWTIGRLAVHVGQAHRWVEAMVRDRAAEELPDDAEHIADYEPAAGADALDAWLADGADKLAGALRTAGAEQPMWSWARPQNAGFWARRMAMETVVHRADAAIAAERPYDPAPELAADALDEWFELATDPDAVAEDPRARELLGSGQTLHLHATDVPGAEWLIVRDPDRLRWSRTHAKADMALRATLTDLLLVLQRRLSPDSPRLEIIGERALLDHWLARTAFGASAEDETV
ncbi:maleylpyruvate isomerase N-terminal domain-containing protein [Streptomyces sp. V4-01]|uniref:Maleylpyruvate isomerase N-terminal domain-containing protein n=1 Tax=Actinacidiphila polyblastidii TaxID=3110430 RepID=A0ABU7PD44_9ACTN|nr:maleylpyruvate isomerase N-terminal domain-containing protein [Streptomyces sp. V4-01]